MAPTGRRVRNGQSIAVLGLFASLAVGALLLLLLRPAIRDILAQGSKRASDPQVTQANTWLLQLTNNLEVVFVLISVFGLIVLAVFRSSFAQ